MSLLIKEKKLKSLTPNNKLFLRASVSHFILKLWLWDRERVGRGRIDYEKQK